VPSETWRVVLASGEVREVSPEHNEVQWCTFVDGYHGWGRTQHASISAVAGMHGWPVVEILAPGEPTRAEMAAQLTAVTAERDVLRAQQAPLVALFDEVMAAARMAGLRGAGHEPAEVVLAVRRLGACEGAVVVRDAAMSVADDLAPDGPEASDCEWAHELMHRVAAAVARIREGGE